MKTKNLRQWISPLFKAGLTALLVTGCVSGSSFEAFSTSSYGSLSTQSGDDPVNNDQDNDAEQDADDRDSDDGALCTYSARRSVFLEKVESIALEVERGYRLEGAPPAQKCVRERVAWVGGIDFSHNLEVGFRNCGGFITAAAVKAANGGECEEVEIPAEAVELPALSVRRVLGIRKDCVCYYGEKVETIALRVEKLRFAQPAVCAEHFDEYKRVIGR